MAIAPTHSPKHQDESISLGTLRIEQVLEATKTITAASKPSAETICSGLSKLAELYKCVDDVLNLPSTRDLIFADQNKKWVEELIDVSLTYLDVCGSTRDMVIQFKEHIRDLECAIRMRKCENEITQYQCFRKKMKQDVKLLLTGLKQVDNIVVNSDNQELAAMMQEVKGVSETTVSIFESLLLYLSTPISKPNRWSSMVSKWIHKRKVSCEDQQTHDNMNEFESIDSGLQALCKKGSSTQGEKTQIAKFRLERQETLLDCMEAKLDCIFRHLIGFRASLLNIISYTTSSSSLSRCVQCPRHTNDKAEVVESSGKYNIGGRKFTRMSDDGRKVSKIDQNLACNNFVSHWPDAYVTALPRYLSDHCPLIFVVKEQRFGPIPFRFFISWLNSPSFKKLVEKSWSNSPQMSSCKSAEDTNKELLMNRLDINLNKRLDLKQKAKVKWQIDGNQCDETPLVRPTSVEDIEWLDRPFLPDEIKEAVWACGNKVIAWAKKHKKRFKMFKVDFDKAFGFVNWSYLDSVREHMGFGSKCRMWVCSFLCWKYVSRYRLIM